MKRLVVCVALALGGATVAGFTYTITWNDGTPAQTIARAPGNGTGLSLEHAFASLGVYQVTLTATDKDGGVSQRVTRTVSVAALALLPDGTLAVGKTAGNDTIQVKPRGNPGTYDANGPQPAGDAFPVILFLAGVVGRNNA